MRTSGVLCTLLLMVGACCALPQYGAQQQQQEEQQQAQPEPTPPLSDQQKEALGEFWWQNQGVFDVEGAGGTVVVVQDTTSQDQTHVPDDLDSPFIPQPSPDCDALHGCIPWQYCVDGVFTNTGEGLLALRTPSIVPETYSQKLCGQIGNLCCRIPDAILAAQQQSQQGGDASPYGGGSANGGIIEIISTGPDDGTVVIVDNSGPAEVFVEQISGGGGEYVGVPEDTVAILEEVISGGDATVGTILEEVISGGDGAVGTTLQEVIGGGNGAVVTIVEPVSVDGGQHVADIIEIVETTASGCTAYTHECVPHFQCIDGEINTSGAGLLDLRVKPQSYCTNPEYPEVPGICCRIPGATPPDTPEPTQTCPGTTVCVAQSHCNADGSVNTDGSGLINTRLHITCYVEYVDATNYETGVCCQPPPPPVPVTCPGSQVCVPESQCLTQATVGGDNYDVALINSCNYHLEGYIENGVCCDPPTTEPPIPEPLQTCPGALVCVTQSQCNSDGLLDTELISTELYPTCYVKYVDATNYETGVCCQPPPPTSPPVLVTCPGSQVCVTQGQCLTQATVGSDNYDVALINSCYYSDDQTEIGECCDPPITEPPIPHTLAPLITCPGTQDCVEPQQCNSDGTINTDGSGLINIRTYVKVCYIDAANYVTGVCCQPPTPSPPIPVVTCPANQICLSQGDCTSQSAATGGTGVTSYTTCYLDEANYVTGVCCESPIRVVDVCPGESVCIPEILCQGDILNDKEQYVSYGSGGTWSQCGLSGDLGTPGVCCLNPIDVTTSHPSYPAANQCGVRNEALDLRTGVKLAKNEAQFGEFPWQAIIFFTNFTFKCGASLIDNNWLITAAHCVHGFEHSDFKIRLGEWQVDKYDEPLKYIDVQISSIIVHPNFKPGPVHNDIALIELAAPVTPQYHINTVCLPSHNQTPPKGTRCFASGWGKDAFNGQFQPILKKVDVPIVEKPYCQDLLRKTRLGKYFILDESFLCAGGEENIDACEGDGGGPLVCQDLESNTYFLAGITAWGINCGQKDVPGVYADVQLFRPWIDGIIYGDSQTEQQVSGYGRK